MSRFNGLVCGLPPMVCPYPHPLPLLMQMHPYPCPTVCEVMGVHPYPLPSLYYGVWCVRILYYGSRLLAYLQRTACR